MLAVQCVARYIEVEVEKNYSLTLFSNVETIVDDHRSLGSPFLKPGDFKVITFLGPFTAP